MTAIISDCGRFRYQLGRVVGDAGPVLAFFGVNPSTADADLDDATVRKWRGFTKRAGGSRFVVGNVFAFRATEVAELAKAADAIGPDNDRHLADIIGQADILVPCWGNQDKVPKALWSRFAAVRGMLFASGKPVKVFGHTAAGDPKHPLMLGYDTPLVDWETCRPPA